MILIVSILFCRLLSEVIIRVGFHSGCVQGDPKGNGRTGKKGKYHFLKCVLSTHMKWIHTFLYNNTGK